jgi:hypothetical protein
LFDLDGTSIDGTRSFSPASIRSLPLHPRVHVAAIPIGARRTRRVRASGAARPATTGAFLTLAVVLWLISLPIFGRLAGARGAPPGHSGSPGHGGNGRMNGHGGNGGDQDDQGDDDEGGGGVTRTGPCGSDPGDAAELASIRATIADQCDCEGARNHGRYVSCVAHVATAAVRDGSLRQACRDELVQCAAHSVCGKKNFVTCCRTDASGTARCSIKRRAAACKAPSGGTACVGAAPSCCDACGSCGLPTSTTTTTVPSATTTTIPGALGCCVQSSATGAFDTCISVSGTSEAAG